jgi:uncharacterized protein DUF5667
VTPEETLELCLEEIEAGQKTIAQCAAKYPDLPELEAQLKAAQAGWAWRRLVPRQEAIRPIEARLREQVQAQRAARAAQRTKPARRWAMAALLVALLVISTGAVAASANSLPGDALYLMKRTTESVALFLTPPSGRAAFHVTLAQRRLTELAALVERDNVDPKLLTDLTTEITDQTKAGLAAVKDASPHQQAEVLLTILRATEEQQTVLEKVKTSAPPEAQTEVMRALEASGESQASAAGRIEEIKSQPPPTASPTPPPVSQGAINSPIPAGQTETLLPLVTQAASATQDVPPSPTQPPAGTRAPALTVPTDTPITPSAPIQIPPGQAKKVDSPPASATAEPPASGGNNAGAGNTANGRKQNGSPNGPSCTSDGPTSPASCTPTPIPSFTATPTPCPTNASRKPKCRP